MRVLITSPTYPPINSGLGNAVASQVSALVQAGYDVVVATGGDERISKIDAHGAHVETFPISGAASIAQPIRGNQDHYKNFILSGSWDVIILNAWQNWATDLALQCLDKIKCKKFIYSHGISTNTFFLHQPIRSFFRYIAWRFYWWRLPNLINKLDGIFFLADSGSDSRFDDLSLVKKSTIPIYIIPNSISIESEGFLESSPNSLGNRDRLISVGSYEWQKGFDFVLRAYAASNFKNKIPLHFFGQKFTAYLDQLTILSKNLGLNQEFIYFHEGVCGVDLLAEYKKAYLILSGSHSECQPLVLIDGSLTGTPFVARSTGCIPQMPGGCVVDGWREMTEKINDLITNEMSWQNLSNEAFLSAKTIYSRDVNAKKLIFALMDKFSQDKDNLNSQLGE